MVARHFHKEIDRLQSELNKMGSLAQALIEKSCRAFFEGNKKLAQEVSAEDKAIDKMEMKIDERGHSLFATGQPMAVDLRRITMMLKINTDLERIGDHAVNIAECSLYILENPGLKIDLSLVKMAKATRELLYDALESFNKEDINLAHKVLKGDDEIDDHHRQNFNSLKEIMEKDSSTIGIGLNHIMISHNLERIADLANNIAEDVIYWKQGREVRHQSAKK